LCLRGKPDLTGGSEVYRDSAKEDLGDVQTLPSPEITPNIQDEGEGVGNGMIPTHIPSNDDTPKLPQLPRPRRTGSQVINKTVAFSLPFRAQFNRASSAPIVSTDKLSLLLADDNEIHSPNPFSPNNANHSNRPSIRASSKFPPRKAATSTARLKTARKSWMSTKVLPEASGLKMKTTRTQSCSSSQKSC
jgi:hypothetical protein